MSNKNEKKNHLNILKVKITYRYRTYRSILKRAEHYVHFDQI